MKSCENQSFGKTERLVFCFEKSKNGAFIAFFDNNYTNFYKKIVFYLAIRLD